MRLAPTILIATFASTAMLALYAQQQEPRASGTTAQGPSRVAKADDGFLATWLLVHNDNEVALAELVQQRTQDSEVREFAKKMVEDHRRMGAKLRMFAPGFRSATESSSSERPLAGTGGDGEPAAGDGKPQEAGATRVATTGTLDHVALVEEMGKECLASARKELEMKKGTELDRCFVGMAIGGHMQVNDAMTVFQRHASSELATALADGQKTVTMHLQQAKELAKKLEANTASSAGGR